MRLRGGGVVQDVAVSVISTMKVERPPARSSEAPMRVKIRSREQRGLRRHEEPMCARIDDQRGLAHVGGLAAHVGAGDDGDASALVEIEVVGDEAAGFFAGTLDHGVAAGGDAHLAGPRNSGACSGSRPATCGEAAATHPARRRPARWRGFAAAPAAALPELGENALLDFEDLLLGGETLRSYSLSSGVVKRSALTRVCLRSKSAGARCRLAFEISM